MMISNFMVKLQKTLEETPVALLLEDKRLPELLYDIYFETLGTSSAEIKNGYSSLYQHLEIIDSQKQEEIIDLVSSLCMTYECSGFIDGIKIGFQLRKELME